MAKETILGVLAKELGYKDTKEMKQRLGSRGDFGSDIKSRVEEGQGLGQAIGGAIGGKLQDIRNTFSAKGLKRIGRKAYMSAFRGDDILAAYMRGRIQKKPENLNTTKNIIADTKDISGVKQESVSLDNVSLKIVTQNSMSLPGIARDLNVMRQNLQKLVKIWGDKDTEAATGADAHFLKEGERAKKLDVMSEEERKKDISFFEEQDKKEAELEAGRSKKEGATVVQTGDQPEKKEGFLDSIIAMFSNGFMNGLKSMFSVKNLLGVLKRVFLPIVIIGTLFSGIMDGVKKYKETGSFSEAIVAGLGGMLSFLTFGLFGEDTLKSLWDNVSGFFEPVMSTITGIFKGIKDFFKKMFGGTVDVEDSDPKAEAPKPAMPDTKSFAPGKETKSEPPKTEAPPAAPAPSPTPTSPTPAAKAPATTPTKESSKKGPEKVFLTPEQEKTADPLIAQMLTLSNEIKRLNNDFTIPKEERKNKRKELSQQQQDIMLQLDKIKPDLGFHVQQYASAMDIDTSKETSKSLTEKMKQDFKAELKPIESKPSQLPTGQKVLSTRTLTEKSSVTTGEQLSNEAIAAREQRMGLQEKYAKKAAPIIKKLYAEGKIDHPFATEDDYQNIPELAAIRKEQEEESNKLKSVEKGGTSTYTSKSSSTSISSTGNAELLAGGSRTDKLLSSGGKAPSAMSAQPPSSGSELSSASSQIAEGQRMESAADAGSIVNAPTTNNSMNKAGKQPKPKSSSVYNEDLTSMLVGT